MPHDPARGEELRRRLLEDVGAVLRAGAEGALEVAADERTREAVDRVAGPEWRWSARLASLLVAAARSLLRGRDAAERASESADDRLESSGEVAERRRSLDDPISR